MLIIIFINLMGIALIAFTIWWFWFAKAKSIATINKDMIDIIVADGIYKPGFIKVAANQKIKFRFIRKDKSPCAEWVIFENLNISEQLPLEKPHFIEITFTKPGEYLFHCQMNMYKGRVVVE